MPLPFNRALDLKLIAMVKENPIIYNSTHPKHMDFDEREVVWQKIGDALSRPGPLCKSRWINIRDMMRRKYKERLKNTDPRAHIKSYKYEAEMQFTTPFFREVSQSPEDYVEYLEDEANCEVEMPAEVFLSNNSEYERDTKEINMELRRRKDNTCRDISETILQELNPTDPIDVFLLTIGTTLRKFSPYYLNQAKSKIFQVVQDYELEQIVNKSQVPESSESET
ncbi:unnamed protein product [Diatraea saccharalis]|uniref:MADF domain-containing protein n=1 Tax=Diatraea saccharalis TaxID=40085 RepID=A0A9N9REI9_9NEOP|nr:unnamed protein product [Diatraea saccharalis]